MGEIKGIEVLAEHLQKPLKRCMSCAMYFVPKNCRNCGILVDAFCMRCHNKIDKRNHIYGYGRKWDAQRNGKR